MLGLLLIFSSSLMTAHAADTATQETCRDKITTELSTVHDVYRSVLFGSQTDRLGKIVAKTGGLVRKKITGIFETQGRLTSELVWPLVESYRVYRCENLFVCAAMSQSFQNVSTEELDLELLGCAPKKLVPYAECTFAGENSIQDATLMLDTCRQLVTETLAMERAVLKLAVAYDTGYRAMLQFAGMAEAMMRDFPARAFTPLRDMVSLLGTLHQIPCFLGQCDLPDNGNLSFPR